MDPTHPAGGAATPGVVRLSSSPARAFGQYYSGLQEADGVPKLSSSAFLAGLFAERQRARTTMLYGRLRLGAGPHLIVLERQLPRGPWTLAQTVALSLPVSSGLLSVDGLSSFVRYAPYVPGAIYRLSYLNADGGWTAELPVAVVH